MCSLGKLAPQWRTLDLNGHQHYRDTDWHHHFYGEGCETIEQLELKVTSREMRDSVREKLVEINVPGRETDDGFIVIGYTRSCEAIDYIRDV